LGLARQDLHDLAGAIAAYRRALALRPDFAEAAVNLGVALQESGNIDAAMEAYGTAYRLREASFGIIATSLTSAPQMTQAGCYQLVLDRKLGEYVLPDGWVVIAAGNPASERGVHFSMPRPLRNRFVHLDLEPDLDDWCRWAVKAQVRPEIIAFLRFKPELLHTADTTSDANAWPTPRSWEMASQVLCGIARRKKTPFLSGTSEFEAQLLDGTVGPAAASELVAFIRLFRQLPSIDEILLNPTMAPLPTEPSAQIAIATALGRAMSDTSVGRAIAYLDRMPTEMRVMAMRDAAARDTAITHTPEFVRFGVECREAIQ